MIPVFSGSYDPDDVQFLLKPVRFETTDPTVREPLIQMGVRHYSETLAPEPIPSESYFALYRKLLERHASRLRAHIDHLAEGLEKRAAKDREIVLVSFARAGTPIGVLLVRALRRRARRANHYSISIIRGRGLDQQAMAAVTERHSPRDVVFVDGWTGKGAIARELRTADSMDGVLPFLTVVADPAGLADLAATGEDYAIPSGVLNSTVSGLISRSILNDEVVGPNDFHACVWQEHLSHLDESRRFISAVEAVVPLHDFRSDWHLDRRVALRERALAVIAWTMDRTGTRDVNRIKPGIAEATRAVLRRRPEAVFVKDRHDPDVAHLLQLADEANIPVATLPPEGPYRAITVIKSLGQN